MRLRTGPAPCSGRVSLLDFSCAQDEQLAVLFEESDSMWWPHEEFQGTGWQHLIETCAGLGALGMGAEVHNIKVVARNELREATCQVLRSLHQSPVIPGSIEDITTVKALHLAHPSPSMLAAGTACQPFSNLGDKRGFRDPRARTLPCTLRAGMLLQSSSIILECVAQAGQDQFVQACLRHFCKATGFQASQTVLDLADVWAAKRCRWWCVLCPASLQPLSLRPWQPSGCWKTVGDVLTHTLPCEGQLESLRLSKYEFRRMTESKPLADLLLRSSLPLPTSLHSWGNQLTGCPCGCRLFPFTEERLSRGLHAVLAWCHGGQASEVPVRHLAPAEVALLNGVDPCIDWQDKQRLGLCLLGQLASPLQSSWIFSQLRAHVSAAGFQIGPVLDGSAALNVQRSFLLQQAAKAGIRKCQQPQATKVPQPVPAIPNEVCEPRVDGRDAIALPMVLGPVGCPDVDAPGVKHKRPGVTPMAAQDLHVHPISLEHASSRQVSFGQSPMVDCVQAHAPLTGSGTSHLQPEQWKALPFPVASAQRPPRC